VPIARLCPHCKKANKVAVTQVGTKVRCYSCGEEFKVKSSDTTVRRMKSKPHPSIPPEPKVSASLALENAERDLKRQKPLPDVNFADQRIEVVDEEPPETVEEMEEEKAPVALSGNFPKRTRRLRDRTREAEEESGRTSDRPADLKRGFNRLGIMLGFTASLSYVIYKSDQLLGWSSAEIVSPEIDKYILTGACTVVLFLGVWLLSRLGRWVATGFRPGD
jgi:hypothetical protein